MQMVRFTKRLGVSLMAAILAFSGAVRAMSSLSADSAKGVSFINGEENFKVSL